MRKLNWTKEVTSVNVPLAPYLPDTILSMFDRLTHPFSGKVSVVKAAAGMTGPGGVRGGALSAAYTYRGWDGKVG